MRRPAREHLALRLGSRVPASRAEQARHGTAGARLETRRACTGRGQECVGREGGVDSSLVDDYSLLPGGSLSQDTPAHFAQEAPPKRHRPRDIPANNGGPGDAVTAVSVRSSLYPDMHEGYPPPCVHILIY